MLMTSTGSLGRPETCLMIPSKATFRVILRCLIGLKKVVHQPEVIAIHCDEGFEVILGKGLIEDGATVSQVPAIAGPKHDVNEVAHVAGSIGLDGKLTPNSAPGTIGGHNPLRVDGLTGTQLQEHVVLPLFDRDHFGAKMHLGDGLVLQGLEKNFLGPGLGAVKWLQGVNSECKAVRGTRPYSSPTRDFAQIPRKRPSSGQRTA